MSKADKGFQPPTLEQRQALAKYQKDFRKALPHITQLATDAKTYYDTFMNAPAWAIADNPKAEGEQRNPQAWTVGHAKVNYVDHIETTNNEGTQSK